MPISRHHILKDTARPVACTRILTIDILVLDPIPPVPRKRGPGKSGNRAAATPETARSARAQAILTFLGTRPGSTWHARQIAQAIGHTGPYRIFNT